MVDVRAGRAFIELYLNDRRLDRESRMMRRKMVRYGTAVTAVGAAFTTLGVAAGGAAVAGIIKATRAAGDFAETVSKFENVFGDLTDETKEWADTYRDLIGTMSRREILGVLAGFQSLIEPMGATRREAAEMSRQFTKLTADLASFENRSTEEVVRDLMSALQGGSETMAKYGVDVRKAAVNQELLNMGLDPKNATRYEEAMARLNIIMRETVTAQDDATETAGSYNNLLKSIGASFEDLQTTLGQKFLPLMTSFAEIAVEGLKDLEEVLSDIIPQFAALDDAVVELARQGKWEEVGRIIGFQIELGLRKTLGETFVDLTRLFAAQQASNIGAIGFAGRVVGRTVGLGDAAGARRTELIEKYLEIIADESQKQTQELENRPGYVVQ